MVSLHSNFVAESREHLSQFKTLTIVALVLFILTLVWAAFDTRTIDGVAVWAKPAKFALSFVVLFATIEMVRVRLSERVQNGWALFLTGLTMSAAFLSEMAYIIYQAARAEASHFNYSTPFNEFMYTVVMAAGAVLLVAGIAVIGWLVKRDSEAHLSVAVRESIWLGFLASFVLTMIVAGYMSGTGSRFVGVHPEGAPTVPFLGWSGVVGDLRPAHFLSLHAMQILPIFALLWERFNHPNAVPAVRGVAVLYSVATLTLFALALMEIPVIPLG